VKTLSISSRSFLYFLCLLNLLFFSEAASAQDKSPTYAITHAKIFTLSGPTIDDGTIVIQNGKIANVGAAVEAPAGAQVIDGKACRSIPACSIPSHKWVARDRRGQRHGRFRGNWSVQS